MNIEMLATGQRQYYVRFVIFCFFTQNHQKIAKKYAFFGQILSFFTLFILPWPQENTFSKTSSMCIETYSGQKVIFKIFLKIVFWFVFARNVDDPKVDDD